MKVFIVLSILVVSALAQYDEGPKPYSFNYVAEGDEGSSSHEETADGNGNVRGSYSLTDIDGRNRIVDYIAGVEGFSANIRTNEPGTISSNPADVVIESTADGSVAAPRTETRIAPQPAPRQQGNTRFVLVPETDPRARAYYGTGA